MHLYETAQVSSVNSVLSWGPSGIRCSFGYALMVPGLDSHVVSNAAQWKVYCASFGCECKSVPLQAWSGPEGSRKLRFPDFMTTAQDGGKVISLTYRPPLLTYSLTPWCRVLLEHLTGLQLVKKFPAFHRTRRFVTALTRVYHLFSILGQPNPVHIPTSHLLEIHPNIIQTSTPRSPCGLFPSGYHTKTLYIPLSSPIRATCPADKLTQYAISISLIFRSRTS